MKKTDVGELNELIMAVQSTSHVPRLNRSFLSIWNPWYCYIGGQVPSVEVNTDPLACWLYVVCCIKSWVFNIYI